MRNLTAALFGVFIAFAQLASAATPVNTRHCNYAIHGYDTVAYFTDSQPVKGSEEFVAEYSGAKWLFASAGNRDMFVGDPKRHAPQFGGFCAFAAAHNALSDTDPAAWRIVDGKLYLNDSQRVETLWLGNLSFSLNKAESYWLTLGQ